MKGFMKVSFEVEGLKEQRGVFCYRSKWQETQMEMRLKKLRNIQETANKRDKG